MIISFFLVNKHDKLISEKPDKILINFVKIRYKTKVTNFTRATFEYSRRAGHHQNLNS